MSHAHGKIFTKDGTKKILAYYEYNGTSDVAISILYSTDNEVSENWRKGQWRDCTCKKDPIEVFIYTDYGFGFYWPGEVCLGCRAIVKGFNPYEQSHNGWPMSGEPPEWKEHIPLLEEK